MIKPKPAAAKKTRGRPRLDQAEATLPVSIRLTESQRDKLTRLGGSPWVRDRIDKAHEPRHDTEALIATVKPEGKQ